MIIDLPKNVKKIIESLNEHGFEGFAVGGCVRDSLLNKIPTDWDITTNALPADIKKIFKKTFDTGIARCFWTVSDMKLPHTELMEITLTAGIPTVYLSVKIFQKICAGETLPSMLWLILHKKVLWISIKAEKICKRAL